MQEIKVSEHSGFCFGVKQAIEKTEEQLRKKEKGELEGSVFTLGPLIHNKTVTDDLEERGAHILEKLSDAKAGDTVVIRSHGVGKAVFDEGEKLGLNLVNATCPFVQKIHDFVRDAHESGKSVIIVGDRNHPEVIGINGWCENSAFIVNSGEEAEKIEGEKLFLVCQTTIKVDLLNEVLRVIEKKGLEVEVHNTICNATSNRQKACENLAKSSDLMIVIGGKDSSNTKKLFDIASKYCSHSIFVEKIEDLCLQDLYNYCKIGIATGASTPDSAIKEVIATMSEIKEMSMEELLAAEEYDLDGAMRLPRLGEIVNGVVHQVTEKGIIVDMGCKKDGLIPKEEVTLEGEQKLTDLFKAGDEIQAKVIKTDDGEGVITLSKKKLEVNANWAEIKEALENRTVLNVHVVRAVNGGVIANYKEVSGFIPLSQLSDKFVENADEFINQDLDVLVSRIDDRRNRVVFSHKVIVAEERRARLAVIWDQLSVDDIVEGTVMRFTDYGAFIDLGGIDGLLHISEISWGKLKHPQEVLKIGDKVQVKILSMNQEKGKISLGLKQCTPEPWSVINENYEVGQIVKGTVVQIKEYGAFIELTPGLDGLVHISEIAHKRVQNIADELTVGQEVEAKILEIDTEKKRISLSIKATLPEPEVVEEAPQEEAAEEVAAEE